MKTFNSQHKRSSELEDFYRIELSEFNNNKMTFIQVKSALVSGVIAGVLAEAVYVIGHGSVFGLDVHTLVDVFAIAVLTAIVSIIKSIGTTPAGNFIGAVQVK
jgi:hypothetical protein